MNPHERGRLLIDALMGGNNKEAMRLLKQREEINFSIVNRGDNAIHMASRRGQLRIVRYMHKLGVDLEQRNVYGNVPMHYAAKGGFMDLVQYLAGKGADLNILNDDGESPLHEAVKTQTMDVIEKLVNLGMDPNLSNSKTGDTPLHTALRFGAQEAMEGLLIKGAKTRICNLDGKRPEEVAKNEAIRGSMRMYSTMLLAVSAGYIKAKGLKITRSDVAQPYRLDRVGVVIDSIDIPQEFPTGFYCRREMAENSTVPLQKFEEESVYSDVFHIRIFDVNRNCKANIYLPLYRLPSEKELLVIRFISSSYDLDDQVLNEWETVNQVHCCLLKVELIPETTCVCVVNVRPKREEKKVSSEGATITSDVDHNFSLEVQPGSFEKETALTLTVFDSQLDEEDGAESAETEFSETDLQAEAKTENTVSKLDAGASLNKDLAVPNFTSVVDEDCEGLKPEPTEKDRDRKSSKKLKSANKEGAAKRKKKRKVKNSDGEESAVRNLDTVRQLNDTVSRVSKQLRDDTHVEKSKKEIQGYTGGKTFSENNNIVQKKSEASKVDLRASVKQRQQQEEMTTEHRNNQATDLPEPQTTTLNEPQTNPPKKTYHSDLLTNVYQINVTGQQPTKRVKLQIPFCTEVNALEELAIIGANEEMLAKESNESALEVLPSTPQVVGTNLVFEVSHFSIYVASWKNKSAAKEELRELQRQILNARQRRKPAAFFAVVKHTEDRKHVLVVECVMAHKSLERRRKWVEKEGYEEQNPPETGAVMIKPGETYYVDIEGNADLADKENASERKLQFSQCRSSWQPYQVILHENIYDEDQAFAYVKILKKADEEMEETARLRIKLTPPPRPLPTPTSTPTPPSTPPPCTPVVEEAPTPELTVRPKTAASRARKLKRPKSAFTLTMENKSAEMRLNRQQSAFQLTTEDKLAEMTSKIGRPEYKPGRSIGEALRNFFGLGNSAK